MDEQEFNHVLNQQLRRCQDVLENKSAEYATEDRLHNFKTAAALEGTTVRQALAGMLAKHTVSIFDMCSSEQTYDLAVWDEKITDHLNYLILLRAVVIEEKLESMGQDPLPMPPIVPIQRNRH